MNKRGQEGMSITALLGIVLGIVVVVLLILALTGGLDPLIKGLGFAPSQLQTLAKACEGYATGGLAIDFCTYRNNIEGKNSYVNCLDTRIDKSKFSSTPSCVEAITDLRKACIDLGKQGNDLKIITVNTKKCFDTTMTGIDCNDLGGEQKQGVNTCDSGKKQLYPTTIDTNAGVCCSK